MDVSQRKSGAPLSAGTEGEAGRRPFPYGPTMTHLLDRCAERS